MNTERIIHLSEYFNILNKRKFLIIAVMVIIVLPVALFVLFAKPIFRSATIMIIEQEETRSPLTGERLSYDSFLGQSLTFKTHFELIRSQPVMEWVIRELELDRLDRERGLNDNTLARIRSWIKLKIGVLRGRKKKELSSQKETALLVEKLQKKIAIKNVRNTRLLNIIVEDTDPVVAVSIGNSLSRIYIDFDISARLKYSMKRLNLMKEQLNKTRKKLEDAEAKFLEYKEQNNIFSIEGKQKIISQKIEEINDAYIETRNKRLELDAKLNQLKALMKSPLSKDRILNFRSLIENPMIDNLYNRLSTAEIELSHTVKVYKSKHSKVIQIRTRIDKTRKKLEREFSKELENMEAKQSVLRAREKVLLKTISEFETDARELNKKERGYVILQRDVETHQNLYDTLLSKLKETDTTGNINVPNIRISQEATASAKPVRPQKKLLIVMSSAFALMVGIGLAFFMEYMDQTLRTEQDVQKYIGLPVLSVIPVLKKTRLKPGKKSEQAHYVYAASPIAAESYRYLKMNIRLSFHEKKFGTLFITSTGEKEGKTTSVIYLARAISRSGRSVLMIDANLHRPELSRFFAASGSPGLAELLTGSMHEDMDCKSEKPGQQDNINSFILNVNGNLCLLPAGNIPHTPDDLLDNEGVPFLISGLKNNFDLVIIDGPSILHSSDALILASHSDCTLLIVRAGLMSRQMVSSAAERLRTLRVNLLGAVLNQVDIKKG
ncbi:MAG: polysaccharide biosynthesis tyrosine autokinase [Desulfobacteraceae bacterium]|nr:polysaccharide biosynthesis tyrosine autokinase [Desulfobacteraceae bacterium]